MNNNGARLRKTYRSVRVSLVRETCAAGWHNPPTVRSGVDVAALAYQVIGSPDREHFIAIYLDGRHRVIALDELTVSHDRQPCEPDTARSSC